MTTSNQVKAFILRDGEGNFYLLSEETIRNAKVPADKLAALQQEAGDTAGFVFGSFNNFLTNFQPQTNAATLNQNQNQSANNIALGGFLAVGAQTAQNVGIQQGGIQQSNA